MSTFFHLLRRQAMDQRYFFAAALAIGFMPYVVTPFATGNPAETGETRLAVARAILSAFLVGVPLVLGARWLVADFAGGRRNFELARPVSAWALCGSKLAVIALMIFGGAVLASLPTTVEAWRPELPALENLYRGHEVLPSAWLILVPAIGVLGIWVLFTLAQAVSFLFADRGRISLADVATLLVFATLLGITYQRLVFYGALGIGTSWAHRLAIAMFLLGTFGAWRSFLAGSLLDRAHRRHSLAMNLGLLALGIFTLVAAAWVVRPDVGQLKKFTLAVPNADGSRWLLAGDQDERGFEPLFAVDPGQKQATYLAPRFRLEGYPWLSADGRRVAFFRDGGRALKLYEFEGGSTRGILEVYSEEKSSLFLGADDRLDFMVTLDGAGNLRSFSLELPSRELHLLKDPELRGNLIPILHRNGSLFDLLVHRHNSARDEKKVIWTVGHFVFDAKSGELRRGESWTYPPGNQLDNLADPVWWREALPLLEAGISFSQLASTRLVALEGGRGVATAWVGETEDAGARGGKESGSFSMRTIPSWVLSKPRRTCCPTARSGPACC